MGTTDKPPSGTGARFALGKVKAVLVAFTLVQILVRDLTLGDVVRADEN
jgi:hypothetical protein